MTVRINYLDGGIGIELIASGIVSGDEVLEAHKEIYNEENLHRQRYRIIDRTSCDYYCVRPEEIEQIAELDINAAKINPNIVIALVSATDLQNDMARIWQIYVEKSPLATRIFRDRQSAVAWIKEQLSET